MASFRTQLPIQKGQISINYSSRLLGVGSCFAENIGRRMQTLKWQIAINPFGILYNPISISKGLERLLKQQFYTESELFFHQELWHSFDHHSVFSHPSKTHGLQQINERFQESGILLKQMDRLIITLGTAYVFVNKTNGQVVGNCHKVSSSQFDRRRLSVAEVEHSLGEIIPLLKKALPALEVILTVSPVRHIRDGLVENQRSKACLLLAVESLVEQFSYVHYFPAYELMIDDLRDYRFFEADLIHPNELAIDYIWEHFLETYVSFGDRPLMGEVQKIVQATAHRPFHPSTEQHQRFVKSQLFKIQQLEDKHPFLNFELEKRKLRAQIDPNSINVT
ncbi:MAG TPA: GSCFA domain-containing protein [Saprospiraceae bacterium]|nr:GSCFA domain-containing protein [Saprospiraceae bacterium]HMQ83964.1 GSCFA domain-containing protein [Saprospiraceae bacterium]